MKESEDTLACFAGILQWCGMCDASTFDAVTVVEQARQCCQNRALIFVRDRLSAGDGITARNVGRGRLSELYVRVQRVHYRA